jgi:hypothetical protein
VFVTVKVFNNQVITTVTSYNNHSMWNFEWYSLILWNPWWWPS